MPVEASERALSILIHGASKAGKTTLAATSPAPRLLCDVESASRFLDLKRVYWTNLDAPPPEYDGTWDTCIVPTRDWATVGKVLTWLQSGKHPFKSVVIDSISELQNRYMENVVGRKTATQQDWGGAYRELGGLVRDFRDLTMHPTKPLECIVMTAMTKQFDGKFRPWCQGQLQAILPYLMDAVGYLYIDREVDEISGEATVVRRLLTVATDSFEAGERVGGAWPPVITSPNLVEMIDMIFGPEPKSAAPSPGGAETTNTDNEGN